MSDTSLIILLFIVTGIAIFLFARLIVYRAEVHRFAEKTRERTSSDVKKLISVDLFDKEFIELANALNSYTDKQKKEIEKLEEDRLQFDQMVAGISHDFRTPLTAALGYMQLLEKSENLSEEEREYLSIAMQKNENLKDLSDNFFELSLWNAEKKRNSGEAADASGKSDVEGKREVGEKFEGMELHQVNMISLLQEVTLSQYEWISKSGLEFQTNFSDEEENLPSDAEVTLLSDEKRLNRIFENLYSNAKKYARTYLIVELNQNSDGLEVVFRNDLADPSNIDVKEIFKPFVRSNARSKEGSGLGLYVVELLAKQLDINCEAKIEKNEFQIILRFNPCII